MIFDGYCPVRIETFHMTSRQPPCWSPNQCLFSIGELVLFSGKHFLLFDNTNERGCREIALQHKQFKRFHVSVSFLSKIQCKNGHAWGHDNYVAMATELYSATLFQNCTLQLMWHNCKKNCIIVVGVVHSYNCGLWNKNNFQTFDVSVLSYHKKMDRIFSCNPRCE